MASLRTLKKMQTERKLWTTAIELFTHRSFDKVSVAEIAAAAEVSTMTVFNYFPTKEDLVMRPLERHTDELAQVVRERAVGRSAVDAVREQFRAALAEFDPSTGLNDEETILAVVRLIHATPSLQQRRLAVVSAVEEALAAELAEQDGGDDPLAPRLAAAQLVGARRILVLENQRRVLDGERATALLDEAHADADRVFARVESGLGDYCRR
ncbi:TetR/AcrR family transcriptional regulator [Streptomyces sp. CA-249302]|uniref:TetR/AcrR family transcriptional regulator n=1 Tax=Streptomyces sp. CA-249302 TaxID=3240058 RepID=UPI003D919313